MKKTGIYTSLVYAVLTLSLGSCQDKTDLQQEELQSNVASMKATAEKIESNHTKRLKNVRHGKYNLKHVDWELVKSETKNCKSEKDLIKLWEKAGMKNAEEYYNSIKSDMHDFSTELVTNPAMKDWSQEQRNQYVKQTIEKSTKSIRPF